MAFEQIDKPEKAIKILRKRKKPTIHEEEMVKKFYKQKEKDSVIGFMDSVCPVCGEKHGRDYISILNKRKDPETYKKAVENQETVYQRCWICNYIKRAEDQIKYLQSEEYYENVRKEAEKEAKKTIKAIKKEIQKAKKKQNKKIRKKR